MSAWIPTDSMLLLVKDAADEVKVPGSAAISEAERLLRDYNTKKRLNLDNVAGYCINFDEHLKNEINSIKFSKFHVDYISAPSTHLVPRLSANGGGTIVIAHRGGPFGPDNSMKAF